MKRGNLIEGERLIREILLKEKKNRLGTASPKL